MALHPYFFRAVFSITPYFRNSHRITETMTLTKIIVPMGI